MGPINIGPVIWIPLYIDQIYGDELHKYVHFCLIIIDG